MKINISTLSKNNQISNFVKIRPVGAELFRADGQTDIMKLTVAFGNFVNAPKKIYILLEYCIYVSCTDLRGGKKLLLYYT